MAGDADSLRQRAALLVEMRRPLEARQILEPIVAADPSDSRALMLIAECWRLDGDSRRAFDLCRSAVALAPEDVQLLLDCAQVSRLAGYPQGAYDWAVRALKLAPDSLRALNSLTLLEIALKKPDLALSHARTALGAAPGDPDLRAAYALSLSLNHLTADATEQYTLVLADMPTHVYALNNLAVLRLGAGDLHRSTRLFARALAIDPRFRLPADNISVASRNCRRILLARFAVAAGMVGLALDLAQPWAYVVGAALLGWTLWAVSRLPAPIWRRMASPITGRDAYLVGSLILGLVLTFSSDNKNGSFLPGFVYLLGLGLVLTVRIAVRRIKIDSQLRRRGIRLP